ncbi:MAG: methyltransferase domain-containing protein [Mariprofundaceae bacterium]|nr:methyltransferase domain-containing protein [Mariprofundaceae bacterium]
MDKKKGIAWGCTPHLNWELDSIKNTRTFRAGKWLSDKAKTRAYPARLLRYWFMYHFLRLEAKHQEKALDVCEIGIDKGQMRDFVSSATKLNPTEAPNIATWRGVDMFLQREYLEPLDYTDLLEARLENTDEYLSPAPDVIVLLHILEHLMNPEDAVVTLSKQMKSGSIIIGGLPSLPHIFEASREKKIRANPNDNGHVSAFSPKRMQELAKQSGLELEFLTGAFFIRASGSCLEDQPWWIRFGFRFSRIFPSWPGETYWVLRKP